MNTAPLIASPSIPYWRVWVDANGTSRQTRHQLGGHQFTGFAKGADPLWSACHGSDADNVITLVLPAGGIYDWHENPRPQWIIPLSGAWAVETMDGLIVTMGAGELSFGGDQGSRDGRGHRSWTMGSKEAVLLLIQVGQPPPWLPLADES